MMKKLFLILSLGLLLISFVSADVKELIQEKNYIKNIRTTDTNITLDYLTKQYISTEKELIITGAKKWWDILQIWTENSYLDIQLTSPYTVKGLVASNDTKVAEFLLKDWGGSQTELFNFINFYNIKSGYSDVDKNYRLKYAIKKEECSEDICYNWTDWILFDSFKDLPHKNIKISLWVNTMKDENIEWVMNINGLNILEWAAWDVSGATFEASITTNGVNPSGVSFSSDGKYMYTHSEPTNDDDAFYQYNLSTAWDISTATLIETFPFGAIDTYIGATFVSENGSNFYFEGSENDLIYQYSLLTPFNISTASYLTNISYLTQSASLSDIYIKSDGSKLYTLDLSTIFEYNFTEYFNLSTLVYTGKNFTLSGKQLTGVFLKSNGTKFYILDNTDDLIYQYSLSTAWDISTASYEKNITLPDSVPLNLFFKSDGLKFYYYSNNEDKVRQYNLTEEECINSIVNSSWSDWADNSSCQINDTKIQRRNLTEYDENYCGNFSNIIHYEYQEVACNYCSYSVVNSSWSSWVNTSSCGLDDLIPQNRSLAEYDENYAVCYAVTNIASDLWNGGDNETYWEFQNDSCDYCTPSRTNTTWGDWGDTESCQTNDYLTQNRSLTEWDANTCYTITSLESDVSENVTFWDEQESECNYCSYSVVNSSWSEWANFTIYCETNNTYIQNRSLISSDENYAVCYAVTSLENDLWNSGVNITYWGYKSVECSADTNCILLLKFQEGFGTTAYDLSGSENNAFISGASWNNDNTLITLEDGDDYSINKGNGILTLGSDYLYNLIKTSWNIDSTDSQARQIASSGEAEMGNHTGIYGMLLTIILIGTVIFILVRVFWRDDRI